MKQIAEMNVRRGRVVFIRAAKRLSPELLTQALASMPDDDPRWLAVHQLLDEELATATVSVSNPEQGDTRMRHSAGAIDALATLKQRLIDERKRVHAKAAQTVRRSRRTRQ